MLYIYIFSLSKTLQFNVINVEISKRIIGLPMATVRGAWRGLDN